MDVQNVPPDGTVTGMTELMRLIQAHMDRYGVTRATVARRAGMPPQTVQNWRDHIKALPSADHLRGVAEVIGVPYSVVLDAALVDAGYRDSTVDDAVTLVARIRAAVDANPSVFDELWFALNIMKTEQAAKPGSAGGAPLDDAQSRAAADVIAALLRRGLERDKGDDGGEQAR